MDAAFLLRLRDWLESEGVTQHHGECGCQVCRVWQRHLLRSHLPARVGRFALRTKNIGGLGMASRRVASLPVSRVGGQPPSRDMA
jgi:hypothetical protein